MSAHPVIAIGASAGGVSALLQLAAALPKDIGAAVLVTLHIGAHPSSLPTLLSLHGNNRAVHPSPGDAAEPGTLYVAPPDRHLVVRNDRLWLSNGPKEHHARPAIDPLFRSAALAWGPRVIGVVLTGLLDDGAAGLQAIRQCGGRVIVQDPADAEYPDMPRSALQAVDPDACVPLADLAATLVRMMAEPPTAIAEHAPARERIEREMAIFSDGDGDAAMQHLSAIGRPSTYTCPDCSGVLWQIDDSRPPRFRCHTGHAYSLRSLDCAQADATEEALWGAIRALQQREAVLRKLASLSRSGGEPDEAARLAAGADEAADHARRLGELVREA